MSALDDLTVKVERLENKLIDARIKLRQARLNAARVQIGDIVLAQGVLEMRVTHVDVEYWPSLYLKGNPRKNNGEWSKAVQNIYGWTQT